MPRYYYQVTIRHDGLGKQRIIRGADRELVEAAAAAQQYAWSEQFARKLEVAERRRARAERKQELEDNLREAEERTAEAQAGIAELRGILAATLRVVDRIDWEELKSQHSFSEPQPKARPYIPTPPEPQPDEHRYQPQLGLLDRFLVTSAERKRAAAQAMFEADHTKWREYTAKVAATNQSIYESNLGEVEAWQRRADAFEEARVRHNAAVDRRRTAYQALNPEAILDYCDLLLSQSKYPDFLPQSFELDYRPTVKTLVVEYRLPEPDDLPRVSEVTFVRSKCDFVERELSRREAERLYEEVICQVAIRAIHELFEADVVRALDVVIFNGMVRPVNPGTGHAETRCVLSVRAAREAFLAINLHNIEPRACVDTLGGVAGARLADLRPVTPLAAVDRSEDRFTSAQDLGGEGTGALDEWQELVKTLCDPRDAHFLAVGSLARLVGFPSAEKYSAASSRELARTVHARGFGIEPDARHGGPSYRSTDEVALFRPIGSDLTNAYPGAAGLLQLCVMIATADEHPTEQELEVSRDFILQKVPLTPSEHQRFFALERVLCRNPELARRSLARLAKRLRPEQRQAVGEVLVCVAGADGTVSSSEWAALDRACKALELPPNGLEEILRRLGAKFEEPTVEAAQPDEAGEAIPPAAERLTTCPPLAFALDMARVTAISRETSQVVSMLAAVMSEDESSTPSSTKSTATESSTSTPQVGPPAGSPFWLKSLNPKLQPIAARLATKASWSRPDFDQVAAEFKLMPLGVLDAINEWADEHLGDFLLQGDDPVTVNLSILPKS